MSTSAISLRTIGTGLSMPNYGGWHVDLSAPARSVMTDFRERNMVSVTASTQVDVALEVMKHAHTRSAFVLDNTNSRIVGFITAYDITGQKPMLYLQRVGCTHRTCSRDDVMVQDIMEPVEKWQVIEMGDVEKATVRTVLDTLSQAGRTHLPVVEDDGKGHRLRGAFSAAKLLRLSEESRRNLAKPAH